MSKTPSRRQFITHSIQAAALAISAPALAQAGSATEAASTNALSKDTSGSTSSSGWHYVTLLEAAKAIRSRKISPVELTNALLDRITQLDPALHSYATVTRDLALGQAPRRDGNRRRPLPRPTARHSDRSERSL